MTDDAPTPDDSAGSFRELERTFKGAKLRDELEVKNAAAALQRDQIREMTDHKVSDSEWEALVGRARQAAEHGEKELMLLRFPSGLCTDGSRAINNPPNDAWPQTLRGEAAELYRRWHAALRPRGFGLFARVLDFPGGKPGDVGLFLRWGE